MINNISDLESPEKRPLQGGGQQEDSTKQLQEAHAYDPFARPPNFEIARKHERASRVGMILKSTLQNPNREVCPCCGLPTETEPLGICSSRVDLAEIGSGFPLYFEFVGFLLILMILLICLVCINGIVANKAGTNCSTWSINPEFQCDTSTGSTSQFIIMWSLGNRTLTESNNTVGILNLIFVAVSVIAMLIYRRRARVFANEIDKNKISPSDYTIIATNFAKTDTVEDIKDFFIQHSLPNTKVEVKKVVPCYYISKYVELQRKKYDLEMKKIKTENTNDNVKKKEIEGQIDDINKQIQAFEDECETNIAEKFTGTVFVIYNRAQDADNTVEHWRLTFVQYIMSLICGCCGGAAAQYSFRGRRIKVTRAPEPSDVYWENLGVSKCEIYCKRVTTNILSIIVVAVCFGIILGVSYGQKHLKNQSVAGILNISSSTIQGIGFLASIIISIINTILGITSRVFSSFERFPTWTSYTISVVKKLAVAQFLNTAIVTLIVSIIIEGYESTIDGSGNKITAVPIWIKGGLVYNMFFVFISNSFVPPIMALFNPSHILLWWKRRREVSKGTRSKLTQSQANALFQGPQVDMTLKYAIVLKTVFVSAFYANVIPIGMVFSFVGIFLVYWIDKYLITSRHCRPRELSKELSEEMSDILEWFLVIFAAGNLIFDKILFDDINGYNIGAIALAAFYLLAPSRPIVKCISPEEYDDNITSYEQNRLQFATDYDRENPVTRGDAVKEYIIDVMKYELDRIDDVEEKKKIEQQIQQQAAPMQVGRFQAMNNYARNNMGLTQMTNVVMRGGGFNAPPPMMGTRQMVGYPQSVPGMPANFIQRPGMPGVNPYPLGQPQRPNQVYPGPINMRPAQPQLQPQLHPQMQPQIQPQVRPQQLINVGPTPQPQFHPQQQPQFQPQQQPQFQPQQQPPQFQPQQQPQFQPQQQPPQFQPQQQPQFQPQQQPQFRPQPQFQPQQQPVQFQPQQQPQFQPQPNFGGPGPSSNGGLTVGSFKPNPGPQFGQPQPSVFPNQNVIQQGQPQPRFF